MLLVAPFDAVGVPLAVSGGQKVAHAPVQDDLVEVSEANMYSDMPDPLVRNVPIEPLCACTVLAPLPPPADACELPPPAFVELLHAATSNAAPSSEPVSRAPFTNARGRIVITGAHLLRHRGKTGAGPLHGLASIPRRATADGSLPPDRCAAGRRARRRAGQDAMRSSSSAAAAAPASAINTAG